MADQYEQSTVKRTVPPVGVDRRRGDRFPLTMNLRFRRVSKKDSWAKGASLNISKTGILVMTDQPPYVGATIELVVDWPTSSGIVPNRELVVVGVVIRIRGNEVAVSIRKSCFRTTNEQSNDIFS